MEKHDESNANNALSSSSKGEAGVHYESPKNQAAYELLLAEAQTIKEEEVIHVTTDIPSATAAVSQKQNALDELRPEVISHLPKHNMKLYDGLKPISRALRYAESLYETALSPPPATGQLFEKLDKKQSLLNAQIYVHVLKGEIPAMKADAVKPSNAHRQKVTNALNTAVHVRSHLGLIEGKTAITADDLHEMEGIAERLDEIIGLNESQPARIAQAALVRNQFYTLFVRALREVYRGVHYLRGDQIPAYMPAIYSKRGRANTVESDDDLAPDVPLATPATTPATAPVATATPGALASTVQGDPVPVGMPGSNPFLRSK